MTESENTNQEIIERLRAWENGPQDPMCAPSPRLYKDAADEIERLNNEVSDLRSYAELAREHARKILGIKET